MTKEIDPEFSALVTNYFQHDYRERGIKNGVAFFSVIILLLLNVKP